MSLDSSIIDITAMASGTRVRVDVRLVGRSYELRLAHLQSHFTFQTDLTIRLAGGSREDLEDAAIDIGKNPFFRYCAASRFPTRSRRTAMIAFATVISLGVMYYNSIPHNCPADKGFSIEAALDDAQSKPALTVKLNDPLWEEVRFPLMKIGPVFDQEIEIKFRDGHKLRKRCIDLTEPERKRLTQALEAIANSAAKESTKPNR